jgi:hypothetical protein
MQPGCNTKSRLAVREPASRGDNTNARIGKFANDFGDGGEDLGSLQTYIDQVCSFFGMSPCPQIPTISQAVLQVAAFVDVAPDAVRASTSFAIPVGPYADAGNPSRPPALGCSGTGCVDPLNPLTGLPVDPSVLTTLRPLAFISAASGKGPAAATQLDNYYADGFL